VSCKEADKVVIAGKDAIISQKIKILIMRKKQPSNKKTDPNSRRDPDQVSHTFWLSSDHKAQLEELAAASRFTKTALLRHWIETEHAKQSQSGGLTTSLDPFPDPQTVAEAVRGKRRARKS
tara:strand:+ start:340 stop:702 length:363 start_codon:yes stop_codon:yes gene_type:complete